MPYDKVTCECGDEVEIFISQAEESHGKEKCECGRIIQYKSPPTEGITETRTAREIGEVQESDF